MRKKSVLIAIQPYWVFLIIAKSMGWDIKQEKTIEVRKNFPKDENWDKTVEIYCSKDKKSFNRIPKEYQPAMKQFLGKVVGEFVCNDIEGYASNCIASESVLSPTPDDLKDMCLSLDDLNSYGTRDKLLYGWCISNLLIYDKPKELSEFYHYKKFDWWDYGHHTNKPQWKLCSLTRPPQSWCYIEGVA